MQALLTAHHVADRLGVSKQTVRNMVRDGRLEPVARAEGPLGAFLFDAEQIDRLATEATEAVAR